MINKLNEEKKNIDIYIYKNYDKKNRNYEILQNVNEINNNQNFSILYYLIF